jgi:hypothetical protein
MDRGEIVDVVAIERGYKGSRLIIANMFLLLTLCSILPSVSALEVFCESKLAQICAKCMGTDTTCVECKPGYALTNPEVNKGCVDMKSIFDSKISDSNSVTTSYGYISGIKMFVPCSTAGCKNCFSDYSQCISMTSAFSCLAGQKIYVDSAGSLACHPDTSPLPGYGLPAQGSLFLVRCYNDACVDCNGDYTFCGSTGCQMTPTRAYYSDLFTRCFFPTSAHTNGMSLGLDIEANAGSGALATCRDPYCLTCGEDYTKCTVCDAITVNIGGRCVMYNMIPPRFFGKTASVHSHTPIDDCTISNCNVCQKDYFNQISCYRCQNSTTTQGSQDYYLDPFYNTCVLTKDIPLGYGRDLSDGLVKACLHADSCTDCKSDYSRCEVCKDIDNNGKPYYLVETLNICVAISSTYNLVEVGPNITQRLNRINMLSKCPDGCLYCPADSTQCLSYTVATVADCGAANPDCTRCLSGRESLSCFECVSHLGSGFRRYVPAFSSRCEELDPVWSTRVGLLNYYNAHYLTGCYDPNCRYCQEDVYVCTQCIPRFALENGRCYLKKVLSVREWTV